MKSLLNPEMVEAGGIEPPSESLQSKASTCLVRVLDLTGGYSHGQDAPPASLLNLTRRARGVTRQASPLSDVRILPAGGRG